MKRGYIKLYRKMRENPMWTERRVFSRAEAWIDMLWEAHPIKDKPRIVLIKNKTFTVEYGQILWSFRFMSERWKWSMGAVSRFLDMLKDRDMIRSSSGTALTPITICNYKLYHSFDSADRSSSGADRGAELEQGWSKEKNIKKGKKEKHIGSPSGDPPCPTAAIVSLYRTILPDHPDVSEVTDDLKTTIKKRWVKHPSLEWWRSYFERVSKSQFLTGKKKEWIASFPWLVGPKNMTKVLSGQYDDHKAQPGNGSLDGVLSAKGQQSMVNAQNYLRKKRERESLERGEANSSPDCLG